MVKTFTVVHKIPRYLLIYYKIPFMDIWSDAILFHNSKTNIKLNTWPYALFPSVKTDPLDPSKIVWALPQETF